MVASAVIADCRFLAAGAEVVTSLSYQASPGNLSASFGVSLAAAEQLMVDSVLLVHEAIAEQPRHGPGLLCAASIGPYGAHLADGSEYTGAYIDRASLASVKAVYERQVSILARGKPDLLAFETVPTLAELRLIVELMRERPNERAWISMSSTDGRHTAHGETLEEAVEFVNRCAGDNVSSAAAMPLALSGAT